MPINSGGKYGVPTQSPKPCEIEMSLFDSLPKEIRDVINYSDYKLIPSLFSKQVNLPPANIIKKQLKRYSAKNALAAYGPDHPQAKDVK